jgi:hypothetical protein
MFPFPAPWALCGGWAVDAWLGGQTRDHGDIDISVFIQDQQALVEHLPGWQLLAHGSDLPAGNGEWWDGRRLLRAPAHIHARPPELSGAIPGDGIARAEEGFTTEFQLNERSGNDWLLSEHPQISLALEESVRQSPWQLPTVVPEVILFFKATAYHGLEEFEGRRPQDEPDFLALLPHLEDDRREWLRDVVARVKPGHPWLSRLAP